MERDDEIRYLAYCIWEQEGCCDGHDLEHWLKAEVVWAEKQKSQARAKAPPETAEIAAPKVAKPIPAAGKKSARRH